MVIAVSATGPTAESPLDERFGRCPWFVLIGLDGDRVVALANLNAASRSGAGIQSARLVADRGVSVVLTGNCGPKALAALQAAGIEVVTGCRGTVREVVESFRSRGDASSPEATGASEPELVTAERGADTSLGR